MDIVLQYQTTKVSKLDRTYLPVLNQLFDNKEDKEDKKRQISKFREIVRSIVVLKSPLSITLLIRLLSIPKVNVSCRLDLLYSVFSIFVNKDMPIQLLYLSFYDFLLDPQKREKSQFWVDKRETHKKLASKYLQLISSLKGLRQNICNLLRPKTLKSKINK